MKFNWISLFCWCLMGGILGSIAGFTWWHWLAMVVVMAVNDKANYEEGRMRK